MRLCGFVAAALSAVAVDHGSAQIVAGWTYEAGAGTHLAFFAARDRELLVQCRGNKVEVILYIDPAALDPALKDRRTAVFAVGIDDGNEVLWRETPILAETGVISVVIDGELADEIARAIAVATRSIAVAMLTEAPKISSAVYNRGQFPIHGAADAIKAAYAGCGITY
jgi:hypothetical protein